MSDKRLSFNDMRCLLMQGCFGIILQDGWLGRPYDNAYRAHEVTFQDCEYSIQGNGFEITINHPDEVILRGNLVTIYSKNSIVLKHFDMQGRTVMERCVECVIQFYLYGFKKKIFSFR